MRRTLGRAVSAIVAIALAVLVPAPARADEGTPSDSPWAAADFSIAALGQLVHVHGGGWQAGASDVASVMLCGNGALDGAVDCAVGNTADGAIGAHGNFFTAIVLQPPPYPCPCLLRVTNQHVPGDASIGISLVGFPTEPPYPRIVVRRSVVAQNVRLHGGSWWRAWFGASDRRRLTYTVKNVGTVLLHHPTSNVVWGKGTNPTGFVQVPDIGDLKVNEEKTFTVVVPIAALSFGAFHAVVSIDPLGTIGTASTSAFFVPWGLLVGTPIALLVLLVMAHKRKRTQADRVATARGGQMSEPGWYPDPVGAADLRLWDGVVWTSQTMAFGGGAEPPDQSVEQLLATVTGAASPSEPGWYVDPSASDQLRLWDGTAWGSEVKRREPAALDGG